MDISKMRQILAIRQHGSFAKAADALGMAQPSLSKSIARLEDELKVRIFDRSASGSELTPIGEVIIERAARVIAETEDIVRDAALIAGGDAGLVRVGVGGGLTGRFLQRFQVAVVEAHPNLKLHIEVAPWTNLLAALAARELDIVVCAFSPEAQDPRFVLTEVATCKGVAVASPDHPLARHARIDLDEFSHHKAAGAPGGFRNSIVLRAAERETLNFYTTNSYDAVMPIVVAGHATLLAPELVVQPLIEAGALVRLNFKVDFEVSFVAVTTRAANYSPILNKIVRQARLVGQALEADCAKAPTMDA
jgi:DNA-binding transcriptional LysR family regulator